MVINVLAYTQLDSLLTVELSVGSTGPDGADVPVRFMGRSNARPEPSQFGSVADLVYEVSRQLAQMALDLAGQSV